VKGMFLDLEWAGRSIRRISWVFWRRGAMRENSRWEDSLPWMKTMVCGGIAGELVWFGSCCEGERRVYANSTGFVGSSL
jgi:hypothetical protein